MRSFYRTRECRLRPGQYKVPQVETPCWRGHWTLFTTVFFQICVLIKLVFTCLNRPHFLEQFCVPSKIEREVRGSCVPCPGTGTASALPASPTRVAPSQRMNLHDPPKSTVSIAARFTLSVWVWTGVYDVNPSWGSHTDKVVSRPYKSSVFTFFLFWACIRIGFVCLCFKSVPRTRSLVSSRRCPSSLGRKATASRGPGWGLPPFGNCQGAYLTRLLRNGIPPRESLPSLLNNCCPSKYTGIFDKNKFAGSSRILFSLKDLSTVMFVIPALYLIDLPEVTFYIMLCLEVIYCWEDNKQSRFILRKSNTPRVSRAEVFSIKEAILSEMGARDFSSKPRHHPCLWGNQELGRHTAMSYAQMNYLRQTQHLTMSLWAHRGELHLLELRGFFLFFFFL